jgi:hypothetical protein
MACRLHTALAGPRLNDDQPIPSSKEFQILKVMKLVLTDIVKDTATQPGLKHLVRPDHRGIRQPQAGFARERELIEDAGKTMDMRPTTWMSRRRMSWCRSRKSINTKRSG